MRRVIWLQTLTVLAKWRNHFSHLLSVHVVNDVRQREIQTAKLVVLEPSAFDIEMAIKKLKRRNSLDIDEIPAEMIKSGCRTIISEIYKLMNSVWNMEQLTEQW